MDFDTAAAGLRQSSESGEAFLQKLGFLMEQSLPAQTTVTKTRKGFFRPTYDITKVEINFGNHVFIAALENNLLKTEIAHFSSGIIIGRKHPDIETWIDMLHEETVAKASTASGKSAAGMIGKLG